MQETRVVLCCVYISSIWLKMLAVCMRMNIRCEDVVLLGYLGEVEEEGKRASSSTVTYGRIRNVSHEYNVVV